MAAQTEIVVNVRIDEAYKAVANEMMKAYEHFQRFAAACEISGSDEDGTDY
jgi:NifU-like protein involved in Fe-S cluster formation